jgi:2-polyprenyl-6-methoxyphenol hydroxylase-like FAD-dependent oxidoreductase
VPPWALEDAAVLAELLLAADDVDNALWAAFGARRYERVRAIVEWSLQPCRWQLTRSKAMCPG